MAKKQLTQVQMVLNHLKKHKTITPIQALEMHGCYRLSEVIRKLRERGHKISTVQTPVNNKFGMKIFGTYKYSK